MSVSFTIAAVAFLVAAAPDPSLIAPGPRELEAARSKTRVAVLEAEAVGTAVARLQNRVGEWRAKRVPLDRCEPPEAEPVLARLPSFLAAHRDAVQNARAKLARLTRISAASTVAPVLSPATIEETKSFEARVDTQIRFYLEALSWHRMFVVPLIRRCAPTLRAERTPGIPGAGRGEYVAVMAVGGGRLCPSGEPADGRVVTIPKGMACHAFDACDCTPVRIDPAAVIGPSGTSTITVVQPVVEVDLDAGVDADGPRFRRVAATSTAVGPVPERSTSIEPDHAESSTRPADPEDLEVPVVEMEPFPPAETVTSTSSPPE
ncbi:MAG: hypothetical protein HYV07_18425 [Deltaproteobacteria bacterium]|nr:hypothetical protein [Deltaproteobacteria bacterium]